MSLSQSDIFDVFYQNTDEERARQMAAYMKNICPFLGISKPTRTALSKEFLKQCKKATSVIGHLLKSAGLWDRNFSIWPWII